MANIFDLYVNGLLSGTSSNDLVVILNAVNADIKTGDGNDTIIVANAVNTIIDAGAGLDSILVASSTGSTLIGGTGNDYMVNIFGSCKMYGDQGDSLAKIPLNAFFDETSMTVQNVAFTAPGTGFGSDIMYGGFGNDKMFGDSGSITNQIFFQTSHTVAGQQQTLLFDLTGSHFLFGNDIMYGGGGNDVMGGEADVTAGFVLDPASSPGATAIADGISSAPVPVASRAEADFISDHNSFNFGNDIMFGGDGNDLINGDVSVVAHEVAFGVATATHGGQATSVLATADELILYGADQISAGNGDDIIFGDGRDNFHVAVGGTATADGAGSVANVLDWVGFNLLPGRETHTPLVNTSGNDVILGDAGNDTIYGDNKIYYNEADGGTAKATNGGTALSVYSVDGSIIKFGNDTLSGCDGNDTLVGDVLSTELEIVAGTATGAGATVVVGFKNFTENMGNDNISGGNGNDLIVGDVLDYQLLDNVLAVSTVAGHIKVADHFNNSITFGNEILSGGSGADNFITSVELSTNNKLVAQGFDKVSDFSVASDKLTFVGTDMATLVAHTTLSHSGSDTIINFDGGAGGSLTLQNVNVSSLSALHIDMLHDSSTLVGLFAG